MGEGKTEAALLARLAAGKSRAARLMLRSQLRRQATNALAAEYLRRRYPRESQPPLMHANALDHNYEALSMAGIDDEEEGELAQVVAEEWFAPKKRFLAPFGGECRPALCLSCG